MYASPVRLRAGFIDFKRLCRLRASHRCGDRIFSGRGERFRESAVKYGWWMVLYEILRHDWEKIELYGETLLKKIKRVFEIKVPYVYAQGIL